MKNTIKRLLLLAALLLPCFISAVSYAETLEEKLNNLDRPKAEYNTMMSPKYIENNGQSEYIDPKTGELTLIQTDYVLPGRNGLDVEIKRIYKSGSAKLYGMKTKYNAQNGLWVDTADLYDEDSGGSRFFLDFRYGLGAGWRFSFPGMEVKKNADGSSYMFLHIGDGNAYALKKNGNEYVPENHPIKDITIVEDSSYSNGQSNGTSMYAMKEKDGKKTYFSWDGRILGVKDRYGNTINFEYEGVSLGYVTNNFTHLRGHVVTKITDTIGREINLKYSDSYNFAAAINPDGTPSEELNGAFDVTVYLPDSTPGNLNDNKKIVYKKSGSVFLNMGTDTAPVYRLIRSRITAVTDMDGSQKYGLYYQRESAGFTFMNGQTYSVSNKYEDLRQVDYRSNRLTRYQYGLYTKGLGTSGSMQHYKATSKQELEQTGYNSSAPAYLDKFLCSLKNQISYTYTNAPDGFGYPGYSTNESYLKNTYRYSSQNTDSRGVTQKYTYNGLHEAVSFENSGNGHKVEVSEEYDANSLPVKKTAREYQMVNGQVQGTPVTKIENYSYDDYGNLLSYTGPLAQRDGNGTPLNDYYTTAYTYATDRFHILTSKQWKQDGNTLRREEYTVDSAGNVTQKRQVHYENGQDRSILTAYAYDGHGDLIQKTVDGSYTTYYQYGTDADGTNHQGAYLTKEYSLLDGQEVANRYIYDFYTGVRKAVIDPRGNRTNYQYDSLERITRVNYPNALFKSYAYYDASDSNSRIVHTTPNGFQYEYTSDISGSPVQTRVYSGGQWRVLEQSEYDAAGNRIKYKDALGHSLRFQYDSKNRLVRKSWWENDTVEKKFMTLSYTVNSGGNIPLLLAVTDAGGNVARYRYDLLDRLYEQEDTPDGGSWYTTAYAYDYGGNVTGVKDRKGNYTYIQYDDLGRTVKETDPMNHSVQYAYNGLGKITEKKNQRNKSTYYEYDALGRLVREKAPAADGSLAVTRYLYDSAGNLIKKVLPNQYNAALDTPALAATMSGKSYVYDTMNRKIQTVDPVGNITEYVQYDGNGNVKKVVDGLRYIGDMTSSPGISYSYDYADRVTQVTDANGYSQNMQHDLQGQLIQKKDKSGNITTYQYTYDGLLWKVTSPDTGTMEYTYDKLGHKLAEKDPRGNITTYTYDRYGLLAAETDALGNTSSYYYDANGNLRRKLDKLRHATYYFYRVDNRLSQKAVLFGGNGQQVLYQITDYEYDEAGNPTKERITSNYSGAPIRETSYTYYDNNLVNTVTGLDGSFVKSHYDKNGNRTKTETLVRAGVYQVSKWEYDVNNRLSQSIRLVDESSIQEAAGFANIAGLRDGEYPGKIRIITGYTYDILGNITKELKPGAYAYAGSDTANRDKYATSYTYDSLDRVKRTITKPYGQEIYTENFYDGEGNITSFRDARGYITTYTYDSRNRLKTKIDSLGRTTTYSYDLAGNRTGVTNALNYTTTYTYDVLNRLKTVIDPDDRVVSSRVYDAEGRVIKEIDAKGYLSGTSDETRYGTEYFYSPLGFVTKVVNPEAKATGDGKKFTEKYGYSPFGERTSATNGEGETTTYGYDSAGRLIKVTDSLGIQTTYTYDLTGNRLTQTDGRGKTSSSVYGDFGLLLSSADPEGKSPSYRYDLDGNMMQLTDKNGNHTLYTYDSRDLLLSRTVQQTGDSVTYSYDVVGNRAGMTDESGTYAYSYDGTGRLLDIRRGGLVQVSYAYDAVGNITELTDKKGFATTYTYDKNNRMLTAAYSGKIATYAYDANGNRLSLTYPGGVSESYTYDKNDRLLTLTNKKPDQSVISSYTYTYDRTGRQTSKTDSYGLTTYTYDDAGRVSGVQASGKTTVYTYDGAGNRTGMSETHVSAQSSGFIDEDTGNEIQYIVKTSQYVYSDSNRLLQLTETMKDGQGQEKLRKMLFYAYDGNGNQTVSRAEYLKPAGGSTTFRLSGYRGDAGDPDPRIELTLNTYDGFNRLKTAEVIQGGKRSTSEFTYDGDDLRVSRMVRKSENSYTPVVTNYLYDRGQVILETDASDSVTVRYTRGINYIGRLDAGNSHSLFLYNGHGDVVQTTAENGAVQNQYDYDIFGQPTLTVEQYSCAIRYAGEFYDNETGLYYLRARYYDPRNARFLSEDTYAGDPSDPLSLNLYTYCANNPILYIDPTGHIYTEWDRENGVNKAEIDAATKAYKEAKTDAERDDAHTRAENARNAVRSSNEKGTDAGYTVVVTTPGSSSGHSNNTGSTYTFANSKDEEHYSQNASSIGAITKQGYEITVVSSSSQKGGTASKPEQRSPDIGGTPVSLGVGNSVNNQQPTSQDILSMNPANTILPFMVGSTAIVGTSGKGSAQSGIQSAIISAGATAAAVDFVNNLVKGIYFAEDETSGDERDFKEKLKDIQEHPEDWEKTRSDETDSTSKDNKGGKSLEEEYTNKNTGEKIWKHTLKKPDGSLYETPHFRPYPKQLN